VSDHMDPSLAAGAACRGLVSHLFSSSILCESPGGEWEGNGSAEPEMVRSGEMATVSCLLTAGTGLVMASEVRTRV
jgi:hypothetical protein